MSGIPKSEVFSKSSFLGREKRGRTPSCNKFKAVEQLFDIQSFQNGRDSFGKRFNPKIRLDDKNRSDGCIFDRPSVKTTSKICPVSMAGKDLSISGTSLWNFSRPTSIHKINESPSKFSKTTGYTSSGLLGRYLNIEPIKREMSVRSTTYSKASSKFRISNKRKEISFCPISTNAFSRISSELGRYESVPSNPKNSKNTKIMQGGKKFSKNNSEKTIRINRKSDSFNSSNFSSPTTLQTFTGRKKSKAQPDSQLQFRTSPISKSSKRIKLVDTPVNSLEWEVSNFHPTICNHPNRCKQCGMGSSNEQSINRGSLVTIRKKFPYKCPRINSSDSCSQIFLKRQTQFTGVDSDGQHNNNDLYQQNGRDCVQSLQQTSPRALDMVSPERHSAKSRFHPRSRESNCRLGVQTSFRLQQLETSFKGFQFFNEADNDLQHRSFRRSVQQSTSNIHKLASRSRSISVQCSPTSLDEFQGLRLPPFLLDSSMSEKNKSRENNCSSDNSCLDGTAMVCNIAGNVNTTSNSVADISRSTTVVSRGTSPNDSKQIASTSRVACLRRSYQTMSISEEVKKLLLSSWGKGTQKSYDSAWNKWVSWCLEREVDPFSAPLTAVLDFLAWMFQKGFQYRTVNVHRSAISSILPHIDGQPVGQTQLVKKLMKGILRENPPLPKYQEMWDIDIVLKFLLSQSVNPDLDLKTLTKKLTILLAIAAPKRSSEIARLDIRFMQINNEGAKFQLPGLSKTQSDCNSKEIFYPKFEDNLKLCVVDCLQAYLKRSVDFREVDMSKPNPLLRTLVKPHKGASSNTIANWIKDIMKLAGIDTTKFKAHSTRGSSTSKAKGQGVSISEILKIADWSNALTFKKFYFRPLQEDSSNDQFSKKVLSLPSGMLIIMFNALNVQCYIL